MRTITSASTFHTDKKTFSTTNRHLENFLFMHRIRFIFHDKTEDGMTRWTYLVDEKFDKTLTEYKELYPKGFAS